MVKPHLQLNPPKAFGGPLQGHTQFCKKFITATRHNRLPQAYILVGQTGIGKFTLAQACAAYLFLYADQPNEQQPDCLSLPLSHPTLSLLQAGTYPDQYLLTPEESQGEIKVEQVRTLQNKLSLTSINKGWRVVIIDGLLNRQASNAVLKLLEDPPLKTLFFLLTPALAVLLETIRSRCQMAVLSPLTQEQVCTVLEYQRPSLPEAERNQLAALVQGSPGIACQLYDQGALDTFLELKNLLNQGTWSDIVKFGHKITAFFQSKDRPMTLLQFLRLTLPLLFANMLTREKDTTAQRRLAQHFSKTQTLLKDAEAFYLDPQQTFTRICMGVMRGA